MTPLLLANSEVAIIFLVIFVIIVIIIGLKSIRVVRQSDAVIVERLGAYNRTLSHGLHFLIPDKFSLTSAIVLGAIATATAPAATLMVVKQYKAKGKLTDILLPVVALDDAVGLIIFAISFGIAKSLNTGAVDVMGILVEPMLEIILSLGLGALLGVLFSLCEKLFHSRSKRMAVTVTFVMIGVAISSISFEIGTLHIGFSSLLTCMMLGTVFCNMCDFSEELMARADRWTAPHRR